MVRKGKIRQGKYYQNCGRYIDRLLHGSKGRRILLTSLTGMLNLWEENTTHTNIGHVMVTLQGTFKGETGYKCHIMLLVDKTRSGI